MSLIFSGTAQPPACLALLVVTDTGSDTDPDCRVGPAALTDERLKLRVHRQNAWGESIRRQPLPQVDRPSFTQQ